MKMQVLNFTDAPVTVSIGDRLAQGLFIPTTRATGANRPAALRDGARRWVLAPQATMNIYLACTVRGDRGAVAALRALADALNARATRFSRATCSTKTSTPPKPRCPSGRCTSAISHGWRQLDLLIADASGSSFGVGFEVGWVLGTRNARIVVSCCLSRRPPGSHLASHRRERASALQGNPVCGRRGSPPPGSRRKDHRTT